MCVAGRIWGGGWVAWECDDRVGKGLGEDREATENWVTYKLGCGFVEEAREWVMNKLGVRSMDHGIPNAEG